MKKTFISLLTLSIAFSLASCGYNTKDWPRVSIPYAENDIYQININYSKENNTNNYVVKDKAIISDIYSNIAFPYRENSESYDEIKNYVIKLDVKFVKAQTNDEFLITFYSLGISKGYVDINKEELHFVPGDIESFYENIENKISKEEK